jgi:hypothetical protein
MSCVATMRGKLLTLDVQSLRNRCIGTTRQLAAAAAKFKIFLQQYQ